MLHRSFKPAKCKTALQMASSRLKILKNKKDLQIKQLKRELSKLLESGQDQTARIRVEHVVREEKTMAAFELIGIYCELLVARLAVIESQKKCPTDLKEAVASVVFASRRMSDVPELMDVQKHFTAKYGKEFVSAAVELRPDCGVSRLLVEKLSVKAPDGPTKIKIMNAIAEEHNIKWEPKSFGEPDSKSPEDLLSGPNRFETASGMHMDFPKVQDKEPPNVRSPPIVNVPPRSTEKHEVPMNSYTHDGRSPSHSQNAAFPDININKTKSPDSYHSNARPSGAETEEMEYRHKWDMEFTDSTAAARAAAESAERASMAARAAAELSRKERIMRQNSTESQHSSFSYGFRNEPPQRYGGSKLQSENLDENKTSNPSPRRNSGMHYEDMGRIRHDKLAEERHKDAVKKNDTSSRAETSKSRDDEPSEGYLQTAGSYSRKNSSEMMQSDSFGKSGAKKRSSESDINIGYSEEVRIRKQSSRVSSHYHSSTFSDEHGVGSDYNSHKSQTDLEENVFAGDDKETLQSSTKGMDYHYNDNVGFDDYGSFEMTQNDSFGKSGAKKQSSESDINIGYSDEVRIRKQSSRASSRSHSSTFSDEHGVGSDYNSQKPQNDLEENIFAGDDKETIQSSIKGMDSHYDDNVAFDGYDSFFDKPKFDTEEAHEEQEFGLGFSLLGQKSPAHRLIDPNSCRFEENQDNSQAKHSSKSDILTEKGSSPVFDDISSNPLPVDDSLSAKYDDASSLDSEFEGETLKAEEASGSKSPTFESPHRSPKSQMGLTDPDLDSFNQPLNERLQVKQKLERDFFPSYSDGLMEDFKTSEELSSETQRELKFGTLTGGLRNKGKRLPPYTMRPARDTTSSKQEDEYTSTKFEQSSSSSVIKPSISSRTSNKEPNNKKPAREAYRKSNSQPPDPSSSDDDSKEELPRRASSKSEERYNKQAGIRDNKRANLKAPLSSYLHSRESDDDEEVPRNTSNVNTRPNMGLSRRTKVQQKTPERSSSSNAIDSSEAPVSARDDERDKRSSYSYETKTKLKPQSHAQKSSLKPSSESKRPLREENSVSLAKERTSSSLPKIVTPIGTETASPSNVEAPSKEKASHVHPKLPDYDDLLAKFETLRSNQ